MSDLAAKNQRRSLALLAPGVGVAATLIAAILVLVGLGWVGVVLAAVIAGLLGVAVYRSADTTVLRACGATPADPEVHARLHNLVAGLCAGNGLAEPSLYLVDDPAPNAFVTGRSPRRAALVVTTGLLDRANRVELEAVLAHHLSHVKTNDIAVSTLAASVLGRALSVTGTRYRVVDPERSAQADLAAVEMTRFPPGLIGALEKVESDPATVTRAPRASAHLWFVPPPDPGSSDGTARLPSLEDRLAVLREL